MTAVAETLTVIQHQQASQQNETDVKFRHNEHGETLEVAMSGELEVATCSCLENFWELRVAGHRRVRLDLADVTSAEPAAMDVLVRLMTESLAAGSQIAVAGASGEIALALEPLRDASASGSLERI